jgi:8-oxo-dGTP diphosphatase
MAEESLLSRLHAEVRFCQRCGSPLKQVALFGALRPLCQSCGWIYFADPKVAAGVLVDEDGKVLLVQRNNEPGRGMWTIPGGFVNAGEEPASAAARECLEETGLEVEIIGLLDVIPGREHDRGADFVIVYLARVTGGDLIAGDDAQAAEYFIPADMPPIAFRATEIAIDQHYNNRGGSAKT